MNINENDDLDLQFNNNNLSIISFEEENKDFHDEVDYGIENNIFISDSNKSTAESDDKEKENEKKEVCIIYSFNNEQKYIIPNNVDEDEDEDEDMKNEEEEIKKSLPKKTESEKPLTKKTENEILLTNKTENEILSTKKNENEILLTNKTENEKLISEKTENEKFLSQKTQRTKPKKKNKCSDENIRRNCKHMVIESLLEFINKKIRIYYNNNIGKGICTKQLQDLNQKQKSEPNIEFNKQFLKKNIGEIFSEMSGRYTNYSQKHNYNLIQSLLNDKDININTYFNKLFNLTFMQCFAHFRGTEYHEELNGMRLLSEELESYTDEDDEYIGNLKYYFSKYEEIINNKKSRKSKKSKELNSTEK